MEKRISRTMIDTKLAGLRMGSYIGLAGAAAFAVKGALEAYQRPESAFTFQGVMPFAIGLTALAVYKACTNLADSHIDSIERTRTLEDFID